VDLQHSPLMKAYQRGILVATLAILAGLFVRVKAQKSQPVPTVDGGWRELTGPEFR
jgi:hypothetical protein